MTTVTLGNVESGIATLMTKDHQLIKVPTNLLSPNLLNQHGALLTLTLQEAQPSVQQEFEQKLANLRADMVQAFGQPIEKKVIKKCCKVAETNHTSITVEWPKWGQIGNKTNLYSIICLLDGQQVCSDALVAGETRMKLTGFEPGSKHSVKMIFSCSDGRFESEELEVKTSGLDDLSSLLVYIDHNQAEDGSGSEAEKELRVLKTTLQELGAQTTSKPSKATHILSKRTRSQLESGHDNGKLLAESKVLNIPIVDLSWLWACQKSGKMESVSKFYPNGSEEEPEGIDGNKNTETKSGASEKSEKNKNIAVQK